MDELKYVCFCLPCGVSVLLRLSSSESGLSSLLRTSVLRGEQ